MGFLGGGAISPAFPVGCALARNVARQRATYIKAAGLIALPPASHTFTKQYDRYDSRSSFSAL